MYIDPINFHFDLGLRAKSGFDGMGIVVTSSKQVDHKSDTWYRGDEM